MKHARKLGSAQQYVLDMLAPEWPSRRPDARTVAVLRSLQRRGLAYDNYGAWRATEAGARLQSNPDET